MRTSAFECQNPRTGERRGPTEANDKNDRPRTLYSGRNDKNDILTGGRSCVCIRPSWHASPGGTTTALINDCHHCVWHVDDVPQWATMDPAVPRFSSIFSAFYRRISAIFYSIISTNSFFIQFLSFNFESSGSLIFVKFSSPTRSHQVPQHKSHIQSPTDLSSNLTLSRSLRRSQLKVSSAEMNGNQWAMLRAIAMGHRRQWPKGSAGQLIHRPAEGVGVRPHNDSRGDWRVMATCGWIKQGGTQTSAAKKNHNRWRWWGCINLSRPAWSARVAANKKKKKTRK